MLGLVINLALGVIKLVSGVIGNSYALLSDAVNSWGDSLSSVMVLFALHFAQRPADAEHPYGYTRAEAIAALNVALLIIITAVWIGWQAIRGQSLAQEPPPFWALGVAGGNVLIKEALYRYKARVGRQTGSTALVANALDHRSDAFCSLAVLIGLAVVRVAGPTYGWVDQLAAVIVVLAIIRSGLRLFRNSASELMDLQAEEAYVDAIRRTAERVPGVCAVEKLWVRKTGLEYLADLHLEVDARLTVAEGHRIGHAVKDQLMSEFCSLRDVLVHLEPYPHLR